MRHTISTKGQSTNIQQQKTTAYFLAVEQKHWNQLNCIETWIGPISERKQTQKANLHFG